jgi:hypothetical protein
MARIRREKTWTVSDASLSNVREAIVAALASRNIRITADREGTIDGEGGSALRAALVWTDKTAPYRVHISFWETSDARVAVEGAFEERPQMSKAGPVKTKKYSRLADEFLDDLRAGLARAGRLDADSVRQPPPEAGIPDQLAKLADLRDRGVLTEEEFETKKTQLLDRM